MKKIKSKMFIGLGLIILGLALLVFWGMHRVSLPVLSFSFKDIKDELPVGRACIIKDENGNLITKLSRQVHAGDEIINAEGKHYRVHKVEKDIAFAKFIGMDQKLLSYNDYYSKLNLPATMVAQNVRPVAIYHTHSDESYLPSDGTESIPFNGGIFDVGDSYSDSLQKDGARVLHDKTPHDPHDDNAYYRSRRTVAQLLRKNPIAIFDVHRDGIDDPEFYRKTIQNQDVAQIRLVIGRENPRTSANLDFARRLMSYANKMHWPVAKEIFIGQGNYNQDMLPTAILIEAGTYTNKKEEAMRGISLLADAVPVILGITGPPSKPGASEYDKPVTDPTARQKGGWTALAWIVAITLLGGGIFLLISAGSWNKAKEQISHFFGREFGDLFKRKLR